MIAVTIWSQNKWNRSVDTEDGSVASVLLLVGDKMRVKKKKRRKELANRTREIGKCAIAQAWGTDTWNHTDVNAAPNCSTWTKQRGLFFFFELGLQSKKVR